MEAFPFLHDHDYDYRRIGSVAIIHIDKAYREALTPVLLDAFGRLGSTFRTTGIYSLFPLLEDGPRFGTLLVRCYGENIDRKVRRAVAEVRAGSILEFKEALPILVRALLDEEPDIATAAARSLCVLGPDAVTAVPNLVVRLAGRLDRIDSETFRDSFDAEVGHTDAAWRESGKPTGCIPNYYRTPLKGGSCRRSLLY